MKKKLIILIICFIVVLLWARFISTKGLIVKEYSIVNDKIPESFDGIKIVQFSDLHYGSIVLENELSDVVDKINLYKPHLVIFTGDLVEHGYKITDKEKENITKLLTNINSEIGKYYIKGNHDYEFSDYENIMNEAGFIYLNNETKNILYKSKIPIVLSGCTSILHSSPKYEEFLSEESEYYTIFVAHEPDTLKDVRKYNIDLMLSGHSHGGQVRIPFIGAIITTKGSRLYYDAYYKEDETELFVSSGIGTSGFKLRFFNKPSINLYRLNNK